MFRASAIANSSASLISFFFPRWYWWFFHVPLFLSQTAAHPTSPISNRDPSVSMFPGIILACVSFVVAVSLSCIMTFSFYCGVCSKDGFDSNFGIDCSGEVFV
jgi:hypothetical protein